MDEPYEVVAGGVAIGRIMFFLSQPRAGHPVSNENPSLSSRSRMSDIPAAPSSGNEWVISPGANPSISSAARLVAAGSIAVIWATSSSMRGRYRTLRRINRNEGRSVRGA
jgi:hypothetical protein